MFLFPFVKKKIVLAFTRKNDNDFRIVYGHERLEYRDVDLSGNKYAVVIAWMISTKCFAQWSNSIPNFNF